MILGLWRQVKPGDKGVWSNPYYSGLPKFRTFQGREGCREKRTEVQTVIVDCEKLQEIFFSDSSK